MGSLIYEVRTDRGFGDDIHLASQQFFQVLLDGDDIQQASFRLHFDQQVQIAARWPHPGPPNRRGAHSGHHAPQRFPGFGGVFVEGVREYSYRLFLEKWALPAVVFLVGGATLNYRYSGMGALPMRL